MFTAAELRGVRAALTFALFPLALTGGCAKIKSARRARIERHFEVAKVFRSSEPYSTRKLSDADLGAFLAKSVTTAADSESILEFYNERENQFAWILGDSISENAEAFVALSGVDDIESKAATKSTKRLAALYDRGIVEGKHVPLCDSCATELELRLTAQYYHFIDGPHGGDLTHDLNTLIPFAKRDYTKLVDSLAHGKMDLDGYEPVNPQYKLLKTQLQSYAKLTSAPWPVLELPAGKKKIKKGDSTAVVADIGARLHQLGDLADSSASAKYDTALVGAVKRFQSRHGMHADGVIDSDFVRAINVTPAARIRSMIVNMERMRWGGEPQSPNLLLVNIPEFRLHVIEDGKPAFDMDVVVGKAGTSTTTFSDTMTQVVFSPSWDVPPSIIAKEIMPGIAKDHNYLEKHHMVMTGSKSDPGVRELPGPTNSLGRVKFLFPNSYSVYMHDTPAKSLFEREDRAASHGCIRLAEPEKLARFLFRGDANWTDDKIHAAMMSGTETFVKLAQPWPVSIVYFTAWVDGDGQLQFRDDVYGHDATLAGELFASK